MCSGHRKHPPGLQRLPRHHPENAPAAVRTLVISLQLFTNMSPNSPCPHNSWGQNRRRIYYWRLAHHPSVFRCFILTHDSEQRLAGFFPPRFYLDRLYFCHSMKPLATSLFFIQIKNDIVVYIYVYVLAPARLWRSHHLVTSRSPSLAPRPLIFWPTGLSAALSVSEHWRSPADRSGDGVAGRGLSNTGKAKWSNALFHQVLTDVFLYEDGHTM